MVYGLDFCGIAVVLTSPVSFIDPVPRLGSLCHDSFTLQTPHLISRPAARRSLLSSAAFIQLGPFNIHIASHGLVVHASVFQYPFSFTCRLIFAQVFNLSVAHSTSRSSCINLVHFLIAAVYMYVFPHGWLVFCTPHYSPHLHPSVHHHDHLYSSRYHAKSSKYQRIS